MAAMRSKVQAIYSLEQLSAGETFIHNVHPLVKMLTTLLYIFCVISFDRYTLSALVPYVFYPIVIIALAEVPYGMILRRMLLALPFCLLIGLSNVFFDTDSAVHIGTFAVSYGVVSFFALLFRTALCVLAVLVLVAVTPFRDITGQLRRLRVPDMLVSLFEMTYRYIGTLLDETSSMYTAYRLRSRTGKGLEMRDMGSFVGQLLIRSFGRAERVYGAMKCRGYPSDRKYMTNRAMSRTDWYFLVLVCGVALLFRFVNIPIAFARWLGGLI